MEFFKKMNFKEINKYLLQKDDFYKQRFDESKKKAKRSEEFEEEKEIFIKEEADLIENFGSRVKKIHRKDHKKYELIIDDLYQDISINRRKQLQKQMQKDLRSFSIETSNKNVKHVRSLGGFWVILLVVCGEIIEISKLAVFITQS